MFWKRKTKESEVLNDILVSVPVGSEENYSFKRMRKSQYEDVLFKFDDEKFEIGMVIDSTISTVLIMEPLAEDIKILQNEQEKVEHLRFQYRPDGRALNAIHVNAVTRIDGDYAQEILCTFTI
jgi:paired amphipathic helix protein Sin3a